MGNVFAGGFPAMGGSFDNLDNVECVYVADASGEYEVRVMAAQSTWQDYARVIDNADLLP